MKKYFLLLISFLFYFQLVNSQDLTGTELLDKAIQYHDPNSNWNTFQGAFYVIMKTPKKSDRVSTIKIDLPKDFFSVQMSRDSLTTNYIVTKDSCHVGFPNIKSIAYDVVPKDSSLCEKPNLYKNYYTYLYGLPMKLKDEGTIIDPKVTTKTFKGKSYLVLKVTYKKTVGKDTWYFYFDPKTYAMEVYQFFKDESKKDGEYILLSGEEVVNGIKMPKKRAWYYNKDNSYLGTDILMTTIKK